MDPNKTNVACGLVNVGASCYMNAILQCLLSCDKFIDFLFALTFHQYNEHSFLQNIILVLKQLRHSKTFVYPSFLYDVVKKQFPPNEQHDMAEFLHFLFEKIHLERKRSIEIQVGGEARTDKEILKKKAYEHYKDTFEHDFSEINQFFYGQCFTTLSTNHYSFDAYNVLMVPLPESVQQCTVHDCLNLYFDDGKTKFWSLPPFLIIQLKRFSGSNKNNCNIRIENALYLQDYCHSDLSKENPCYELKAIAKHIGGVDAGHCFAECRRYNSSSSVWVRCDDLNLSHIESPLSDFAYLFFYERKNDIVTIDNGEF